MKTTTLVGTVVIVLVGLAALGQDPEDSPFRRDSRRYKAAFRAGREEADRELAAGRATIYVYGLRSLFERMDRETGLPYRGIAGCVVDDAILGRAAGHNDRIAEFLQQHGPPSNSFKRWEEELFDLERFYETRIGEEQPHRLVPGGPAVRSPDGKYTIRPVTARFEKDDGSVATTLGIVISVDGGDHKPLKVLWDEGETDFLWGPKGSGFAVIRCQRKDDRWYMALDLKGGNWLREGRR